jgi:pathogenesis-related protein 1
MNHTAFNLSLICEWHTYCAAYGSRSRVATMSSLRKIGTRILVGLGSAFMFVGCLFAYEARAQQPPPFGEPISGWAAQMLDAHNAVRAQVGIPPLMWSGQLAAYAQEWADYLAFQPTIFHRPNNIGYGENIFGSSQIGSARFSPGYVINDWVSERRYYDPMTNYCSDICGHYTQVVWSNTRFVGCGISTARGEIIVCNYYLPGNYVGKRPF